jgi:glycerate dehydrogenase
VVLGEHEFSSLPDLKLVSVLATGVNVIDLNAAQKRGVTVCNVPGYSTDSTAQHCIALLLELTNRVGLHDASTRAGDWECSQTFSYYLSPLIELRDKTIGIVGFGSIGAQVARIAQALGMRVIAHSRTQRNIPNVRFVDKDTLLLDADVISLHCPLTEETRHFIDRAALRAMKPKALLINGSRGPVVDEVALAEALGQQEILGAATDVLTQEPPQNSSPLLRSERCIVTPHIAWASETARARLIAMTCENIRAYQRGQPTNVVSAP